MVKSSKSSKQIKPSFLPKHRVYKSLKFKPSAPPHYFYTALQNDSFITEVDDTPISPTTSKPSILCRRTPVISLTLQNSGSVARDHLASERTFLAYMRTSLALASAGVGTSISYTLYFVYRGIIESIPSTRPCPVIHSSHSCRPSPSWT
jgi:Domain of unknown function (DUF202)